LRLSKFSYLLATNKRTSGYRVERWLSEDAKVLRDSHLWFHMTTRRRRYVHHCSITLQQSTLLRSYGQIPLLRPTPGRDLRPVFEQKKLADLIYNCFCSKAGRRPGSNDGIWALAYTTSHIARCSALKKVTMRR